MKDEHSRNYLYCMKYFITYPWFLFRGRFSSSTLTIAFRRSRNCGALFRWVETRVMIFCTWYGNTFIHVVLLPVNTYKYQIFIWLSSPSSCLLPPAIEMNKFKWIKSNRYRNAFWLNALISYRTQVNESCRFRNKNTPSSPNYTS